MALSTLPQISLSPVFDRCWLLGFLRKWFGGTSFSKAFLECQALPRAQQREVDRYHADLRALQLPGATSAVCRRSSPIQGIFFFFLVELVLKRNGQHTVENCNCSFQSRFYSAQHWAWSRRLWILVLSNLSVKQDVSLKKKNIFSSAFYSRLAVLRTHWGKQRLHCIVLKGTSPVQHSH